MAETATALIKFKHCNFGEHYAEAQAAYDSNQQTAWIASFTSAQRAYWAQQGGNLINGYAEAYAATREASIGSAAQSAFDACMGGASSTPAMVEPVFRLTVQAQLNGGGSSGGVTSTIPGLSTQLRVPFAPSPASSPSPLDWQAFYRVGPIQIGLNFAANWALWYPSGGGYDLPSYTTLPMRPAVAITANNLVSIAADLVQYIDVPAGKAITLQNSSTADFTAVQSFFSFTLQRQVNLPDGQIIQEEFVYDNGYNDGALANVSATVQLPGLTASCDVSGYVDVYHFITAYAFGTLYKLANKMQQVRVNSVDYDFEVPANASGSVPPSYGPPGYNSIHESFYFLATSIFNLGIIRVKYYDAGVFLYQKLFLAWNGAPASPDALVGLTMYSHPDGFYDFIGGYETYVTFETLWVNKVVNPYSGDAIVINAPIIDDVVVSDLYSAAPSVSTSAYISYVDAIIKIHNTLKPYDVFTPYGPFVTDQPGYQATGNFLSVLPDFVDYRNWAEPLGVVRVKYYDTTGALYKVSLYLAWKQGPTDLTGVAIIIDTTMTQAELSTASEILLSLHIGSQYLRGAAVVIEEASCIQRHLTLPVTYYYTFYYSEYSHGDAYYADPANPSTGIRSYPNGDLVYPGYPYSTATGMEYLYPTSGSVTFTDFTVTSTGSHCSPYTLSNGATIVRMAGVIAYSSIAAGGTHLHFFDTALTNPTDTTNTAPYAFLEGVDDFIMIPNPSVYGYRAPDNTWPSLI